MWGRVATCFSYSMRLLKFTRHTGQYGIRKFLMICAKWNINLINDCALITENAKQLTLCISVASWLGRLSLWYSLQMAQKFIRELWLDERDDEFCASICDCSWRWRALSLDKDSLCCVESFSNESAWRFEPRCSIYSYIIERCTEVQ